MSDRLTEEQIEDLVTYCGSSPTIWRDTDMLICCPVHGESNPSMGISSEKQVCHCFACGFAGGFAKLLSYSLPDEFGLDTSTDDTLKRTEFNAWRKARDFLKDRYELEYYELGQRLKSRSVKRYEQLTGDRYLADDERKVLPTYKLAPFKSGKETYAYFFQRKGDFTKAEMQKFMIGRDTDNLTVTIPVFYEDNTLAGIIGRYISSKRRKNERYKIYDNFERSKVLYPLNLAKPIDGVAIIVEGQFDTIRMHRIGYTNTYSPMTDLISDEQVKWLCENCDTVIWVGDNDDRGLEARDKAHEKMKGLLKFKIVDYPDYGKDVCDWSDNDIHTMIRTSHSVLNRKLRRIRY